MVCRRCGTEFDPRRYLASDGSTQCPRCRTIYRRNASNTQRGMVRAEPIPYRNSQKGKPGKGKKTSFLSKRLWKLPVWVWILIAIVLLIVSTGSGSDHATPIQNTTAPENVEQAVVNSGEKNSSDPVAVSIARSADFGDSKVEAVQATIRMVGNETYVICEYNWTNSSDQNAMFLTAVSEKAFQNGIELDVGILLDVDTNTITEVMPGYSLTVRTIYTLTDPSAEITFMVSPFMDILNEYTPLTFTVNPN